MTAAENIALVQRIHERVAETIREQGKLETRVGNDGGDPFISLITPGSEEDEYALTTLSLPLGIPQR